MALVRFEIENIDDAKKAFALAPSLAKNLYGKAITKATLFIFGLRRNFIPQRTRQLMLTTQFRILKGGLMGKIFTTKVYGPFVHEGTKPHTIRVKSKKVLANRREGEIYGKTVRHPGQKANPFFEKMLKTGKPQIDRLFQETGDKLFKIIANKIN